MHKVHLAPASRYSEDIDLVVVGDRPKDHIDKAIRRVLADVLGKPKKSIWHSVRLAVRNAVRPSEILQLTYQLPSQADPRGKPLEIVVEANVTERKPHRDVAVLPFSHEFRGTDAAANVNGFDIHEMLGTKMRALFQRKRGRDLFDLYWALTNSPAPVEPAEIIESFVHYMKQEDTVAERDEFIDILQNHLKDSSFLNDMKPLLRTDVEYDPLEAGDYVIENLLSLLPSSNETSRPRFR